MNYLAHAYLSFNDEEILVGNLISDFVKGKKKLDYPEGVQKGITLHRSIDTFTDTHAATAMAKQFFRPAYRLYSAAFVDVVYDHFLANDDGEFSEGSLFEFSQLTYNLLDKYSALFPGRFARMFPYMKRQNWLFNYRQKWGTEQSFEGVVRRAAYLVESKTASLLFEQHYAELRRCYQAFFPDLKFFARNLYNDIRQL